MEALEWASCPRECLAAVFGSLPPQDRCLTLPSVCSWWREVALDDATNLLPDLNCNRVPLFLKRTRSLPHFAQERASFIAWLRRRRTGIRRLSITAERWEDDSQAAILRMAVAEIIAPRLEALRLVCTDSGQATSAFLSRGGRLRELQLDFWGRGNALPRSMAACTALTRLSVQCSSGLEQHAVLASLHLLQDLSVSDPDWGHIPTALLQLPLTRLHIRHADLVGGCLPADVGRLAGTLRELSLPGCQISTVPDHLARLSALTSLVLDRSYMSHLPDSLSSLSSLQALSCEGCAALREFPVALAEVLHLRSLDLMNTAVLRLPVPAADGECDDGGNNSDKDGGLSGGGYLQHLTELRWGVVEWDRGGRFGGDGADSEGLPDLTPLLHARRLKVVQLAHVPKPCEGQVATLRCRLRLLQRLQVNSAVLVGG